MIHDVDESLRAFIQRDALGDGAIEVAFDAPTKDWSSRRNSPTVDLYLYDIREEVRQRHNGDHLERDERGVVVGRRLPPRWFRLSYLVTAWTQRPIDEHRILSSLLIGLLSSDRIPPELLVGSLSELGAAISYTCALPPTQDRALSDVWSALGGELKPSLDVVVTVPFDLSRIPDVGPPVLDTLGLVVTADETRDELAPGSITSPRRPVDNSTATRPPHASQPTRRKKKASS